jgi:hypothetical protein
VTDPRTPSALSNATPPQTELEKAVGRWLHAKREQVLREDSRGELIAEVRSQERDVEDAITEELEAGDATRVQYPALFMNHEQAAPPVAEGPAATSRPPHLVIPADKRDHSKCKHWGEYAFCVHGPVDEETGFPKSAAEPFTPNAVEARAAAIFFEPLGYCVHSVTQADCGSCCRRILAALQRQLDEARRELAETQDTLHCARHLHKVTRESAEAANQDLRRWLPISEAPRTGEHVLVTSVTDSWGTCGGKKQRPHAIVHWFDDAFYLSLGNQDEPQNWPTHFKCLDDSAALLGPQHGQKEK